MMKRSVQEAEATPIDGDGIQGVTMKLLVGREDHAPTFAMRHFSVEPNGYTPEHHHPWEHEVLVLSGEGELNCDGKKCNIKEGDSLYIPSGELHQFLNTGEDPLAFICVVPVESECGEMVPGS